MVRRSKWSIVAALAVLASACGAMASVIPVGTGTKHAEVYIEFNDGASYRFDVAFEGSPTGMELLDIIEANEALTTTRVFGGMFLDGVTYDGHSNVGYGGGENWWHYWTREPGLEWFDPQAYGAFDRIVQDGSSDGWIYGRIGAPLPEPATLVLLGAASLFVIRRGKRTVSL